MISIVHREGTARQNSFSSIWMWEYRRCRSLIFGNIWRTRPVRKNLGGADASHKPQISDGTCIFSTLPWNPSLTVGTREYRRQVYSNLEWTRSSPISSSWWLAIYVNTDIPPKPVPELMPTPVWYHGWKWRDVNHIRCSLIIIFQNCCRRTLDNLGWRVWDMQKVSSRDNTVLEEFVFPPIWRLKNQGKHTQTSGQIPNESICTSFEDHFRSLSG